LPPVKDVGSLRLFMTADTVGGVWQYAIDLARGLAQHDVRTTLAVLGPKPDQRQALEARSVPGLDLVQTDLPLDWTAESEREMAKSSEAIAALADRAEADLIHLNSAALAVGASFGAPVVAACHSCVATWWDAVRSGPLPADFVWRTKLVAKGYGAADALIAPTASFAAATARTYGLAELPRVVYNGRHPASPRVDRPALPASFVFTAGRLWDEGKNLVVLDRAAAKLPVPILAAGPLQGPNGASISFEHLKTLGSLGNEQVARWLKAAPIFASAARYEPFGLATLEAAQAGCVLILSDIATFRELWDGAALFVPSADPAAFADAIQQVNGDVRLRTRLGAAARERARRYSVEAMSAGMRRIYASLLTPSAEAPRKEPAFA
jgi:glycosyltransferase involved in cell wall biosynthesis